MIGRPSVSILMYHSVSAPPTATSIPPDVFRMQCQVLEDSGCHVVSLRRIHRWLSAGEPLPGKHCVALTFDDGFRDFQEVAAEELERRGWPATVFFPVGFAGDSSRWESQAALQRPLLDWSAARELAARGFEFGGHGERHLKLPQVSRAEAEREVARSFEMLSAELACEPYAFAYPYGEFNHQVRQLVAARFQLAVTVELARVRPGCHAFKLPRIEMLYFQSPLVWKQYLTGCYQPYLGTRRILRRLRALAAR